MLNPAFDTARICYFLHIQGEVMRKGQCYFICFIFSLILISTALFGQSVHTITRENHPVIVRGSHLDTFLGLPVDELRLMQYHIATQSWHDIPFQFDELDSDTTFFGTKNNLLDPRDELLFLSQDFGDSAAALAWPTDLNSTNSQRILITGIDPLTREKGWVYLYHSSFFTASNKKYIQVNEADDIVLSNTYEIVHGESGFQENFRFLSSAGGDDLDLLDRQKFRFQVEVSYSPFGSELITIKEQMNEDIDLEVKLAGQTLAKIKTNVTTQKKSVEYLANGNIRLHRKLNLLVILDFESEDFQDFELEFPFIARYYPAYSEWQIDSLQINLDEFNTSEVIAGQTINVELKTKQVRFSTDLNSYSVGMQFYNTYNPDGIRIDGRRSDYNNQLNWPGKNWYLITANPDDSESQIKTGSLVSYIPFESDPIGDHILFLREDKGTNRTDTGDLHSYGNTGVKVTGSNITGTLNYYAAYFYLAQNMDTTAAHTLIDQHIHPIQYQTQVEIRPYQLARQVRPPNTGSVSVDPDTNFFATNELATLTAEPEYGFEFVSWTGDTTSEENPLTLSMYKDFTVTANFRAKDILVVIETDPTGFQFYADYIAYTSPRSFNWKANSNHIVFTNRIIEETDTRYLFDTWSHSPDLTFNYLVPDTTDTITAFYDTEFYLQVSSSDSTMGSTNIEPPGVWISKDSLITLYPIANPDYGFVSWSGDIESTNDTLQFLMESPKNIVANFANWPPQITLSDTSFAEDDTLVFAFTEINDWFFDENHPDSLLTLSIRSGKNLIFHSDSVQRQLYISTKTPDWNGQDTLFITVTDPTGISASDYSIIQVDPMNDAPEPFKLLCPPNGMQYPTLPREALFNWEESFDIDKGDTLVYTIILDTSSTFSSSIIVAEKISESHYLYPWPVEYGIATYYWKVSATDTTGAVTYSTDTFTFNILTTTSVEDEGAIPKSFGLHQNMPNPFNNSTRIQFDIPEQTEITLRIFNSRGQLIQTLLDGTIEAGYHHIVWDGKNNSGTSVASGMYFIQIAAPKYHKVRKMLYIR